MMCAFMTPVLKNDWEVYNSKKRSRNNSEASNKSFPAHQSRSQASDLRRRALGETRSMSYHMGNTRPDPEMLFARPPQRAYHSSTRNSRNASRASFSPVNSGIVSPTKTGTKANGHHRSPSSSSLTKFHSKVMDKLRSVLHLKDDNTDSKSQNDPASDEEISEVRSQP